MMDTEANEGPLALSEDVVHENVSAGADSPSEAVDIDDSAFKKPRKPRAPKPSTPKTAPAVPSDLPVEPRLPLNRIKAFMKLDPRVVMVSADAVYLTTKATELFVQTLAKQASAVAERSRRKTIQVDDIKYAIESSELLRFLEDMII